MNGLHARDDAHLAEARDVARVEMLRMLDAPAQRVALYMMLIEELLEEVERLAVGAIADGVYGDLIAMSDPELRDLSDTRHLRHVQARVVRSVVVRFQHPGAARAEGAVGG